MYAICYSILNKRFYYLDFGNKTFLTFCFTANSGNSDNIKISIFLQTFVQQLGMSKVNYYLITINKISD